VRSKKPGGKYKTPRIPRIFTDLRKIVLFVKSVESVAFYKDIGELAGFAFASAQPETADLVFQSKSASG
jgi:hypothetical protein